ncbi:MAG: TrmB family transcriptional regulator [Rhizobiales bacterium]|nr:TrmB family transcriptional regulator [Hyphomicrobiales bacterium]
MAVGKVRHLNAADGQISRGLRQLGFTDYEARIYMQLLRESPATAYEVSKAAGVPRANTYSALQTLAQRGAVLPVNEEPLRYVAANPKAMLESISRQTRSLCADLTQRLSTMASGDDDQYVWMVRGQNAVTEKIEELIARSRRSIWVKAADDVIRQHKKALERAARRGVHLMIVLFGKDADEFRFTDNCNVFVHEADGTRMGTADNLFTLGVDHEEMLAARLDGDIVAAFTRNSPIVTMALSLIRHDYYMAEIFKQFGPEIEKAFGPYLRDLRLACFTPEQIDSFRERTGIK